MFGFAFLAAWLPNTGTRVLVLVPVCQSSMYRTVRYEVLQSVIVRYRNNNRVVSTVRTGTSTVFPTKYYEYGIQANGKESTTSTYSILKFWWNFLPDRPMAYYTVQYYEYGIQANGKESVYNNRRVTRPAWVTRE